MSFEKQLYTVYVFAKLNTRRFFRDRLAIFFGILFPLIFLSIFGAISGGSRDISFRVALINESDSAFARQFSDELSKSSTFKVDKTLHSVDAAREKMARSQLDATIVLPKDFGAVKPGQTMPSGQAEVRYTQNNASAGQTLTSALQAQFKGVNAKLVNAPEPYTAVGKESNERSLTRFDYTFAGLLGFAIIGMGIFGPINVFPELKKQGILRRLHTTPIRVWQYFVSTMIAQSIIGQDRIALG